MTTQPKTVRTRIAPSPTGFPHIGTIYQVLFDYAYAKKHNGTFICRIEDTDRVRFVEGSEDVIYSSLEWFGLVPDESPKHGGPFAPYRQSERLEIYQKYAQELIDKKHAYYCFCTKERLEKVRSEQIAKKIPPMYDKYCLQLTPKEVEEKLQSGASHVLRMNIPQNRKVSFDDLITGKIEFDSSVLDDQVIIKSDGFPTYHLAVVVDDHLMEITHIFRGKEWISSTPKHVLLYEFFGWEMPIHGHLPLILNADGKGKLSKRHGHASVNFYRERGFLPEAILNYLSNLVWAHPQGKDIYDLEEFIKVIEIEKINSQGARFDLTKLEWMNGEYIRKTQKSKLKNQILDYLNQYVFSRHSEGSSESEEDEGSRARTGSFSADGRIKMTDADDSILEKTIPLVQTRMKTLSDYWPMCEFFYKSPTSYETEVNKEWIAKVVEALKNIEPFNHETMYSELSKLADDFKVSKSKFFMDIRIAVTGKKVGPPLFESMEILGKDESLQRLKKV